MSSFIYNKKLSEELMKIGRNYINKTGQATDYEFEQGDVLNVAKTLLNNLGTEIQGATNKFETLTGKETSPEMKDLSSLSNLESFLAGNQILSDGKPISEWAGIEKDHKINTDGLKNYILKLRSDALDSKNKLFILLVGKLIKQANDKYKLDIPDVSATQKESEVDSDNLALDSVPIIIKLNDLSGSGKQLLGKDLKTQASFASWIKSDPKSKIFDKDKDRDITINDLCPIINYLFQRAEKGDVFDIAGEKNAIKKIYISLLQKLAAQINCVISGATSAGADEGKPSTVSPAAAKALMVATQKLFSVMPFEDNAIDLDKILSFVNGYSAMFQDKIIQEELGHYDTLKTLYPDIINLRNSIIAKSKSHRFEWNNDIHMVKQSLINKFGKDYHIAKKGIAELKDIIDSTKSVIGVLMQAGISKHSADLMRILHKQIDLANSYFSDLNTLEWEMRAT